MKMKIEPERLELIRLWDEDAARDCSHSFDSLLGSVFMNDGGAVPRHVTLYRCKRCGQLRKPKRV